MPFECVTFLISHSRYEKKWWARWENLSRMTTHTKMRPKKISLILDQHQRAPPLCSWRLNCRIFPLPSDLLSLRLISIFVLHTSHVNTKPKSMFRNMFLRLSPQKHTYDRRDGEKKKLTKIMKCYKIRCKKDANDIMQMQSILSDSPQLWVFCSITGPHFAWSLVAAVNRMTQNENKENFTRKNFCIHKNQILSSIFLPWVLLHV